MNNVSTDKLVHDMRAVIVDAEDLLKATASQTGERVEKVRAKAEDSLRVARERLKVAGDDLGMRRATPQPISTTGSQPSLDDSRGRRGHRPAGRHPGQPEVTMPNPVRRLLGSASGFARSRLELFGTELREEQARFAWLLLGGCGAIVLVALTLAVASAAVILASAEAYRVAAASSLALLFAGAAAFAVLRVRSMLAARPGAFGASLAELDLDRDELVGRSHQARTALADSGGELTRLVSLGVLAYAIGKRLGRAA